MRAKAKMNESTFLEEHPDAERIPPRLFLSRGYKSKTTRAYLTQRFLWLFDKGDGHLALKYDRRTNEVL